MKEIYKNLWVGRADEILRAKEKDFSIVSAYKDGLGGHRDLLGYEGRSAPDGKEYLFAERPKHLYLNMVDANDASLFDDTMVEKALAFVSSNLRLGHKVLIACNRGESRAPSLALIWLVENGHLPRSGAIRRFRQIYPDYAPARGIQIYTRQRIAARR